MNSRIEQRARQLYEHGWTLDMIDSVSKKMTHTEEGKQYWENLKIELLKLTLKHNSQTK